MVVGALAASVAAFGFVWGNAPTGSIRIEQRPYGERTARAGESPALAVSSVEDNVQVSSGGSTFAGLENRIDRILVFRATPLYRVVTEIQRRYGVAVDLEDDSLSELNVTATFTDEDVETVIFVVCEIVGAGCTVDEGRFRIGVGTHNVLRSVTRLV